MSNGVESQPESTNLLINDNDGQGRKRGLTLGPINSDPFLDPWHWKRCQFVETSVDE